MNEGVVGIKLDLTRMFCFDFGSPGIPALE